MFQYFTQLVRDVFSTHAKPAALQAAFHANMPTAATRRNQNSYLEDKFVLKLLIIEFQGSSCHERTERRKNALYTTHSTGLRKQRIIS